MKCGKEMLLAMVSTLGFLGSLYGLFYVAIPKENKDLLNILLGVLASTFSTQTQFFFGSSSSSRLKDMTIANMKEGDSNRKDTV